MVPSMCSSSSSSFPFSFSSPSSNRGHHHQTLTPQHNRHPCQSKENLVIAAFTDSKFLSQCTKFHPLRSSLNSNQLRPRVHESPYTRKSIHPFPSIAASPTQPCARSFVAPVLAGLEGASRLSTPITLDEQPLGSWTFHHLLPLSPTCLPYPRFNIQFGALSSSLCFSETR